MSTTSTEKATGVRPIGEPHAGPPGMAGPLRITVVWGNIAEAQADLHVVGHYRGVMPSGTERVIDQAISPPGSDGIICRHARRRWLVGALGEVTYFPGPAGPATGNTVARVAVVGMGRVGTFGQENARTLFRTLLREVLELGDVRRLATVLIGSGADNLSIPGVAGGLVTGFADGLRATPGRTGSVVPEVLVVERDRLGAELALHALRQAAGREPAIAVSPDIVPGSGGQVSAAAAAVYGIRGLLERLSAELSAPAGDGARGAIPGAIPDELRDQVSARLAEIARRPADVIGIALQGADSAPPPAEEEPLPVRVTAQSSPNGFLWSAITGRSTVPEREVRLDPALVEELVRRLTPPSEDDERHLPAFLGRYVVPLDLQRHLDGQAPLIIEVDPRTSVVPWELLMPSAGSLAPEESSEPLAIRQWLARQMRMAYARTDREGSPGEPIRAIVIGDPGDPRRGQSIPEAAGEATHVATILRDHGIDVDLFVGAPGSTAVPGASPAGRLDVLAAMLTHTYDLVHYIGHGAFEEQRPELSGWVFAGGLLTARELAQLAQVPGLVAPRLVVANACWSAAHPIASGDERPLPGPSSALAPVLADEFLRVGTGHFVGASWRLPAESARTFATSFYRAVLGGGGNAPASVGQAILAGRRALWKEAKDAEAKDAEGGSPERRCAWAAYQHYGDPGDRLISDRAGEPAP